MSTYTKVMLGLERLLGLLFIAAAVLKAVDMEAFATQISYYRVVTEPSLVRVSAYISVAIETLLGVALLTGIRLAGLTYLATLAMLAVFSGLVAYSWAYFGLSDCGCFGKYVKMTPGATIIKNIVMMAVAVGAWHAHTLRRKREIFSRDVLATPVPRLAVTALALACVLGAGVVAGPVEIEGDIPANEPANAPKKGDGPYAQFQFEADGQQFDLSEGTYFVPLLSADCDHCMSTVPAVNVLAQHPEAPPVAGLMMGDQQGMQDFRDFTRPEFPLYRIPDQLVFFQLLGDTPAPPRFVLVHDGKEIAFWNDSPPDASTLMAEIPDAS